MLIRVRCSTCHLPFTTVRALLEHRAGHDLGTGNSPGPAVLPQPIAAPASTPRGSAMVPRVGVLRDARCRRPQPVA